MVLGNLQTWLTDFYALELAYDVHDFLITDPKLARALDRGGRENEEKLLIAEDDGEAAVSLYLQQEILDRLVVNDPTARLDERNLADFWTALEGLSHFTYFVHRASHDRAVTLLEMELQAEIDKFVATAALLRRQGERPPAALHAWLFARTKLAAELSAAEQERYARANRYAARYCRKLWPRLSGSAGWDAARAELRRFYRLTRAAKFDHIQAA
ncbi:MAG TPA: hypothetical protein VIC71_08695 [Gammaproteobacteria bacterium]|jgi:hypothetical protein